MIFCPFLYPFTRAETRAAKRFFGRISHKNSHTYTKPFSTFPRTLTAPVSSSAPAPASTTSTHLPHSHLNPPPDDYALTPFVDTCIITLTAGAGGHGCISFFRDMFVPDGPPNGGDGGHGGSIFIQALRTVASLNAVAKARQFKAGSGGHGQGGARGGKRGRDILIEVPLGTVVREVRRWDPVRAWQGLERTARRRDAPPEVVAAAREKLADRWLLYPGMSTRQRQNYNRFPELPQARYAALAAMEPQAPMRLDLDFHMTAPMLLAAGAVGGQGNPHFVRPDDWKPKVATKGEQGLKIALALELKLVADVGLVGLPNAGKSTLLRAVSASRARVGSWAFTTLQPNIGTVILEDYKARSKVLEGLPRRTDGGRTRFTIADIPGLIENAHQNRGLGLDFLRHVERARVLAFVVDLSAGDAVVQLKALWREVAEYQLLKEKEEDERYEKADPFARIPTLEQEEFEAGQMEDLQKLEPLRLPSITGKPWFVIGTKADCDDTQQNFLALKNYVDDIRNSKVDHPSGRDLVVRRDVTAIPISAIRGEGVNYIIGAVLSLLDS